MDILVIGGNHHNTLGVIRSLGKENIFPNVIIHGCKHDSYVVHSKYVKQSWIIKSITDIDGILHETFWNRPKKTIVIVCDDKSACYVNMHSKELSQHFVLPGISTVGEIARLMDKATMASVANLVGIQTPISWILPDEREIAIRFPLFIKPLKSIEGSKSDICVAKTLQELDDIIASTKEKLLAQIFIEKEEEFQVIGCSLNDGKEIVIPGVTHIIRSSNITNTGFLLYDKYDDSYKETIENCKHFIRKIGFSGLFSMEFLRSNGNDYFMEINFRNDGNAYVVYASGVNLPYLWVKYNTIGLEVLKEVDLTKIKPTIMMPEFDDFILVLKGKISLYRWLIDIKRTNCFLEYDRQDSKPFWLQLRNMLTSIFKNAYRKIAK